MDEVKGPDNFHIFKRHLWMNIASACAGSSTTVRKETAVIWADYIANEFEKRYGPAPEGN